MLILSAIPGVLPASQRWWLWTCGTGVAMGLFGLWYVPLLQRGRARAAAARLAARAAALVTPDGPGSAAREPGSQDPGSQDSPAPGLAGQDPARRDPAGQDSSSLSDSRDSGSNTVSSTDTPGRSTRS